MDLRELAKQQPSGSDLAREPFPCADEWPDLDGKLFVRSLSGLEWNRFEASLVRRNSRGKVVPNADNSHARFFVLVIVDESGKRVFQEADADWLGEKANRVLERAWEMGFRLSRGREEDREEAEKKSVPPEVNGALPSS